MFKKEDANVFSVGQVSGFITTDFNFSSVIKAGSSDPLLKVRQLIKQPVARESVQGFKVVK